MAATPFLSGSSSLPFRYGLYRSATGAVVDEDAADLGDQQLLGVLEHLDALGRVAGERRRPS